MKRQIKTPAIYKHFKKENYNDNSYLYTTVAIAKSIKKAEDDFSNQFININAAKVFTEAQHTETNELINIYVTDNGEVYQDYDYEDLVIYMSLYNDNEIKLGTVFARPYDMFCSEVDKSKYPSVKQKYRFEEYNADEYRCPFCGGELRDYGVVKNNDESITRLQCDNCLSIKQVTTYAEYGDTASTCYYQAPKNKIISTIPNVGVEEYCSKSYVNAIQLHTDDYKYTLDKELNKDFPGNFINTIKSLYNSVAHIFVDADEETRDIIFNAGLAYNIIYPNEVMEKRLNYAYTIDLINGNKQIIPAGYMYDQELIAQLKEDKHHVYKKLLTNDIVNFNEISVSFMNHFDSDYLIEE